jgi:hypothetical protein
MEMCHHDVLQNWKAYNPDIIPVTIEHMLETISSSSNYSHYATIPPDLFEKEEMLIHKPCFQQVKSTDFII